MNLLSAFRRSAPNPGVTRPNQPIEVGIVTWGRGLTDSLGAAQSTGQPIFALFQEVPGCAGCKQFGADVLSHPVIVDAIEEAFVPLLVHNNAAGRDAEMLALFDEPAWNYQVVRFLDAQGADVLPRRDRVWEAGPLAIRMVTALRQTSSPIPRYLQLFEQEHSDRLQSLHLVQTCFWVGERELGQIEGVVTTQAGFMDGHEITTVTFDPSALAIEDLAAEAVRRGVATRIFADPVEQAALGQAGIQALAADYSSHRIAPERDQKHELGRGDFRGLTKAQRTKLNAFLRTAPEQALSYLAPSQRHPVLP